ncbi:MAG: FAD-binding protein [Acidimicrobiia bacterium]
MTAPGDWPHFDGRLRFDNHSREAAGDDFGHIVRTRPVAVLEAASEQDVAQLLRFAPTAGLRVAPRGQGHSTHGQAQAPGGIVLDLSGFDRIHALGPGRATVEAGVRWFDIAIASLKNGMLPPVLTDYLGLSIGGTLSVGGVSGTSFWYGAQVDHVDSLVVATGTGDIVTCGPDREAQLFEGVLAGLGQCGVILRATLRLVAAAPVVRVFRLTYPHPPAMISDLRLLAVEERFDYLLGIVTPSEGGGWDAQIEAMTSNPGPDDGRLAGLRDLAAARRVDDRPQALWVRRVEERVAALQAMGLWGRPHPWLDLFVPAPAADRLLADVLATPVTRGVGPLRILLYPLRRSRVGRPLLRLPEDDVSFLLDVLCTAGPAPGAVGKMVAANRVLFERCRELGGTLYPIGAVPLTPADWERHFGPQWDHLAAAKRRFDPEGVLTPGPGIFP